MKKYLLILILILLFLSGCNGFSSLRYYRNYYDGKLYNKETNITKIDGDIENNIKKYCIYSISYFIPMNFWSLRFTDKQWIVRAIKDLNKDGVKGKSMKNIYINTQGFASPIYSQFCIQIKGEVF